MTTTINGLKIKVAANITYQGATFNTPLFVEYKHTGVQYFKAANKYTDSKEIADKWKADGKKVKIKQGYYFISRIAIPTTNAKGEPDIWYVNNTGDTCTINKASKYWKKIHTQLSNNINLTT